MISEVLGAFSPGPNGEGEMSPRPYRSEKGQGHTEQGWQASNSSLFSILTVGLEEQKKLELSVSL